MMNDGIFSRSGVSVLIPVMNERENVAALFLETEAALCKLNRPYEIIFVDDASRDGTAELLQDMAQQYSCLRLLQHKQNYGQSAAICTAARAAQYPWLVTMDGDGQNDPADIPSLLELLQDWQTVVLGNRRQRHDNWLRKLSSRIGNGLRRRLLQDDCPDTGCSLKIFPREAFLAIPHFKHMHRYLPALFRRQGLVLLNAPVNHRARAFGQSKYGVMNRLWVGIHDLVGVRWLLKRPCLPELRSNDH